MTSPSRRPIVAGLALAIAVATIAMAVGRDAVDPAPSASSATSPGPSGDAAAASPGAESSPEAASPPATPAPTRVITADVVVYGATPSGVLAAVSAARLGSSAVLVTPEARVGGMLTSGLSHTDIGRMALIGGITRVVFGRIMAAETNTTAALTASWNFEPHVASTVLDQLLAEANVRVETGLHLDRTRPPDIAADRIRAIRMTDGSEIRGTVFVDATYEGDLMAAAGVRSVVGRESKATYGEQLAGVFPNMTTVPASQLVSGLDSAGLPLAGLAIGPLVAGSADGLVQPATFRLCATDRPANRIPFAQPPGYDPAAYVLVGRRLASLAAQSKKPGPLASILTLTPLANGKADLNNAGLFSTDLPGGVTDWATADDAGREAIWNTHKAWVSGLLWYLETSVDVPAALRGQVARWGLCADEFRATGGWPPQLYIREARRMVGSVVLTQRDIQTAVTKPDPIALGTYRIDAHFVRFVLSEGDVVRGDGQLSGPILPYQIPYAAIVPPPGSVDNLLVSVTISASHVAWASIRTEPTLMQIGEAAGVAAALAVRDDVGVRQVDPVSIAAVLVERGGILAVPATGVGGASVGAGPPR